MPIDMDEYFTVTPSTNFKSKSHAILGDQELFFYISDTNELRVKVFGGLISYTLAVFATWVETIAASDRIHVYYSNQNGSIFYIPFQHLGAGNIVATPLPMTSPLAFSILYAAQASPPAYILVTDDGVNHRLWAATDPLMANLVSQPIVIYTNLLDNTKYVTRPTIAMHPDDVDRITINVQQDDLVHATKKVGFYVVRIPGLA